MTIRFTCECGKLLQAREEHAGRLTRCPACGRELNIPAPDEGVRPTAAPPPLREPAPERARAEGDEAEEGRFPRRRADEKPASSGKALAALLLSIGSLCLWFLTSVPAFILALLSLRDIKASGGRLAGKGMAVASLIISGFTTVCFCPGALGIGYLIKNRIESAAQVSISMNNLRQLGLAMHMYHGKYLNFPPAAVKDPKGKAPHSWRVEMLPFLGEQALYNEFRRDEPWDSPHNLKLLEKMPKVYQTPGRPTAKPGMTYYQVITAPPNTPYSPKTCPLFGGPVPARFDGIKDGTSNTILIVEAADPVPWTAPEDVVYAPNGPLPRFGDPSKSDFPVVMADGSVRRVSRKVGEQTLRNAITPADGMLLGPDW